MINISIKFGVEASDNWRNAFEMYKDLWGSPSPLFEGCRQLCITNNVVRKWGCWWRMLYIHLPMYFYGICREKFYVLFSVHFFIILQIKPTWCTVFLSMFISSLYMFRATMCPSSGKITLFMRDFVFVILYGWLVCSVHAVIHR